MNPTDLIDSIKEGVEKTANVSAVFGEPYQARGNITIIPVASVKFAGGGGNGMGRLRMRRNTEEGSGGNGMGLGIKAAATPLGYIEIKDEKARFVSTADKTKVVLGGLLIAGLSLMSLNRMMRDGKGWKSHRKLAHLG